MSTPFESKLSRPPRNNWGWIGFFVFVTVASIGVAVFMIWFNLSVQLTAEELEEKRKLWEQSAIKDYDMTYVEKHTPDNKPMTFVVKVRKGIVEDVLMNGKPLEKNHEQKDDPRIFRSMDALFHDMDRFMHMDSKPGASKVYVVGRFDPETGALRQYIHRDMTTKQRVEIEVKKFVPVNAAK